MVCVKKFDAPTKVIRNKQKNSFILSLFALLLSSKYEYLLIIYERELY